MKKALVFFIAFAFIASLAGSVMAADLKKPVEKFVNGTMEVVKSPMQLVEHPKAEIDSAKHMPFGLLKGLIESPFHILKKAGHGAVDMATFPIE